MNFYPNPDGPTMISITPKIRYCEKRSEIKKKDANGRRRRRRSIIDDDGSLINIPLWNEGPYDQREI
jgi:hypothetical protein